MTFSECYRNAIDNGLYEFKILRFDKYDNIINTFEFFHHIIITENGDQIMKERYELPLEWLTSNKWELKNEH